eukprot:scpid67643/ scgid6029/ 
MMEQQAMDDAARGTAPSIANQAHQTMQQQQHGQIQPDQQEPYSKQQEYHHQEAEHEAEQYQEQLTQIARQPNDEHGHSSELDSDTKQSSFGWRRTRPSSTRRRTNSFRHSDSPAITADAHMPPVCRIPTTGNTSYPSTSAAVSADSTLQQYLPYTPGQPTSSVRKISSPSVTRDPASATPYAQSFVPWAPTSRNTTTTGSSSTGSSVQTGKMTTDLDSSSYTPAQYTWHGSRTPDARRVNRTSMPMMMPLSGPQQQQQRTPANIATRQQVATPAVTSSAGQGMMSVPMTSGMTSSASQGITSSTGQGLISSGRGEAGQSSSESHWSRKPVSNCTVFISLILSASVSSQADTSHSMNRVLLPTIVTTLCMRSDCHHMLNSHIQDQYAFRCSHCVTKWCRVIFNISNIMISNICWYESYTIGQWLEHRWGNFDGDSQRLLQILPFFHSLN